MTDILGTDPLKAQNAYNAAARTFDAEPLSFWDRYGRRTVERLQLRRGARVLDICCGTGASALPAAHAVGAEGHVIAVDLAVGLLDVGRAKATAAGLRWLEFRHGDMRALDFADGQFDAVVCVFGIFFAPDMPSQIAKLWRLVRPGGRLAITTWGPDLFAPGYGLWFDAVGRVRPDLQTFRPWDRITTPDALRDLFTAAGIRDADVVSEEGYQLLRSPDDFWTIVMGTGLRWPIDQMDRAAADAVRREVVSALSAQGTDRVATHVIYAVARKDVVQTRTPRCDLADALPVKVES
jgi:SAM-dependent methyltransferase